MAQQLDRDDVLWRMQTQADLLRLRNLEIPKNPVVTFTVTPLPNSFGATIEFTLGADLTGCSQINVMRNGINDLSSATCLQTYPLTAENANGDFQYIDSDQALLQDQFYWLQTIPLPERAGLAQTAINGDPIVSGPVNLTALNANLLPPDAISDWSVSLGAGSNGIQLVCVNFVVPSDPNFGSCQIQATGYFGDTNPQTVGQGLTSPFSFTMIQTGETVTLQAFAVSQNGINSTTGPTHTITLNGTETVPAKLENIRVTVITTGVQVDFDAGLEADITSYKVYRGPHAAGFGSATLKTTITSTGARHYTFLDTTGISDAAAGAYFDYFVTAVNHIGESSASAATAAMPPLQNMDQIGQGATYLKVPQFTGRAIIVSNANFEASSSILPPPGWKNPANLTLSYETSSPGSGNRSLKITNCPQFNAVVSEQTWPCTPGDTFYVQAQMKGDGVSEAVCQLAFFDKNGTFLGGVAADGGAPTSTSWNVYENSGTAPANSVSCSFNLQQNAATPSTAWFDDIQAIRKSNMDNELQDGSIFRRLKFVNSSNTMSVSTALNPQGSIVPGQALTISFSFTDTTISISWSGQTLLLADSSTLSVVASGGSPIAYSGLSASTSYYIYLKLSVTTGVITAVNPSPPPTSPNATYAAQANEDGFDGIPPMIVTTQPTPGGPPPPPGGGTGGGGDTCPEANEIVTVRDKGDIKAVDVVAGDWILGFSFKTNENVFRKVLFTSQTEISAWRIVNGHKISPTEPVWGGSQWLPAYRVPGNTFDGTPGLRINITVETDDYDESNYWLTAGTPLLIHNARILPC